MKKDVFDNMLKQALEICLEQRIASLPDQEELKNIHIFSSQFENKMNKLIRLQRKPYYSMINTVGKKVALIIITIFIALTTTVLSVDALRNGIFNFFIDVYEKFSVIFTDKSFSNDNDQIKSIQTIYLPQYIPDGFMLTLEENHVIGLKYRYENPDKNFIVFEQLLISMKTIMDTEDRQIEEINTDKFKGIFYLEKELNNLFWDNGEYCFKLSSSISKNELIRIAESVVSEKNL